MKRKQKSILEYFSKKTNDSAVSNLIARENVNQCFGNKLNDEIRGEKKLNDVYEHVNDNVIDITVSDAIGDDAIGDDAIGDDELVNDDFNYDHFIEIEKYLQINLTHESDATDDDNDHITYGKGSYVYKNFRSMIDHVLRDDHYVHLFNDDDWNIIQLFTSLTGSAQMLFIRLFLRKHQWIRTRNIKYDEIGDSVEPYIDELLNAEFIINSNHLDNLHEGLEALDSAEIKIVGRSLKGINMKGLNTKTAVICAINKHIKSSRTLFTNPDSHACFMTQIVLKEIKTLMKNTCIKLNNDRNDLFERIFVLISPPVLNDDDINVSLSSELFKILRIEKGELKYPSYNINKKRVIYNSRDDIILFSHSCKLENEILGAIEKREFDTIINDYLPKSKSHYEFIMKGNALENDRILPVFLRNYTAAHVIIRCMSHCVNVLERQKRYYEAIQLLNETLLKQDIYCQDYRGRWYERLAINLEKHTKEPKVALKVIEEALNDTNVRMGHRLALYYRRKSLHQFLNLPINIMDEYETLNYPETTIIASTLKYQIGGRINIFKDTDANGDVTILGVEEVTLQHYKKMGYSNGIHTEGLVYHALFGLLFWDILYADDLSIVPDSFRYFFQMLPLDFNTDDFYHRRKDIIHSRLSQIKSFDENELLETLENSWNVHKNITSLINWDKLSLNSLKEIACLFGSSVVCGICERLAKEFRFTRSGFPDLLVWDAESKRIKIVEVKGPGDRVSTKQTLWLKYMNLLGIDAEVCHVKAKK